ncbi:hypothetical protein FVE85_0815 [Porphyridium purpureum]|uniref:DUF427 domain-containing protein n=1 Tax=Porphyridium purpureum TaxID=35688 RepID=A0A5J4Z0C7_PORPP|nr:hypothetical protein FVE85_0815 [Porphyridium purpureum]|eukprot:POR4372..scf208_2
MNAWLEGSVPCSDFRNSEHRFSASRRPRKDKRMGLFKKGDGSSQTSSQATPKSKSRMSVEFGGRRSGEFLSGVRKSKKPMKAVWNGVVLAQSEKCEIYDGTFYFPSDALNMEFYRSSDFVDNHPKLGRRIFYTLEVDGKQHNNAAFYYPSPTPKDAVRIANHVAFWKGVPVSPVGEEEESSGSDEE